MTEIANENTSPNIVETIHEIASSLRSRFGGLTTGDVAGLRRMDPRRVDAPGFWKIEAMHLEPHLSATAATRSAQETKWATVIVGLARLSDLHNRSARLGNVLRDAGFSEVRFVRLLRADGEALIDELPTLARFLAAKGHPVDWSGAAQLILLTGDRAEQQRRHVARDYYHEKRSA